MITLLLACATAPPSEASQVVDAAPVSAMLATVEPEPPPVPRRVRIAGDVIPHTTVHDSAAMQGWQALFTAVAPALQAADLSVVNLETPIATWRTRKDYPKIFNAPPELLSALRDSGVDVLTLANNHTYDQGRAGLTETIAAVQAAGLVGIGAGPTCDAAEAAWVSDDVALISATRLLNAPSNRGRDQACVNLIRDEAPVLGAAQAARQAGAQVVVAILHWGQEYETTPRTWDTAMAKRMLDGGIDVVVGHHPHVLQPIVRHLTPDGRTTWIVHSLGNFLSGQSGGSRRDGLIVELEILAGQVQAVTPIPTWTERGTDLCVETGARWLHPILLEPALAEARARGVTNCVTLYEQRLQAIKQVIEQTVP